MRKFLPAFAILSLIFSIYSCKRCTTLSHEQDSIIFNFDTFDTVDVYDIFNVYIKQDSFYSVKIKGDKNLIKNVEVSEIDKNIEISDQNTCYFLKLKHSQLDIYITAPDFRYVQLFSASSVYSVDTLHYTSFGIRVFGYYGNADVCVDCKDHFFLGIWNATGNFHATGNTLYFQVLNHGHAFIHSFDLKSQYANIEQRSTGDVELSVQKKLDVQIFETGNVIYKGNPTINAVIQGDGKLTKSR